MFTSLINFIKDQYKTSNLIPLHEPHFFGNENTYVNEALASTFVSSVGEFVDRFEIQIEDYTRSEAAVVTVNGTSALHIALKSVGVERDDLVITQALTFVATCNAISYCGAHPVFVDVDRNTLGMSPSALEQWLIEHAIVSDVGVSTLRKTGQVIRACLPMHTFGHPVDLNGLITVCKRWGLILIEDAAEALGSLYEDQHVGTFGLCGAISFNGNKIITTGGGGAVLTSLDQGREIKHLTTTAKIHTQRMSTHDAIGYNYRMPNINAALGCAQIERIEEFVTLKRRLATDYQKFLSGSSLQFVTEPENCRSNYWLNAVICEDLEVRDLLVDESSDAGVTTRPVWNLMHKLPMFQDCLRDDLVVSSWLADRLVNLPSSVAK
jgi:aminotransferase in exopolysaccharide biosynthesis